MTKCVCGKEQEISNISEYVHINCFYWVETTMDKYFVTSLPPLIEWNDKKNSHTHTTLENKHWRRKKKEVSVDIDHFHQFAVLFHLLHFQFSISFAAASVAVRCFILAFAFFLFFVFSSQPVSSCLLTFSHPISLRCEPFCVYLPLVDTFNTSSTSALSCTSFVGDDVGDESHRHRIVLILNGERSLLRPWQYRYEANPHTLSHTHR